MKRPKYHFLRCETNCRGKSIVTLPGQTFGQIPVPGGVLVKDSRGSTEVSRARRKAAIGDVFFTTTLGGRSLSLTAKDIHPLEANEDVTFADVHDRYREYLDNQNAKD